MWGRSTSGAFHCIGVSAACRVECEAVIARQQSSMGRAGTSRLGQAARGTMVVVIGWLVLLISPRIVHAAEEPSPLTNEERGSFEQRLAELSDHLAARRELARAGPAAARDTWADVDVYRKGVQWALREQAAFTAADRRLIHASLEQGLMRMDELTRGEMPWSTQRGRVIHGYVSAVDGSTQPFGVIVPMGYDAQRPIRLDVVLHGSTRPVGMSELRFMDRFAVPGDPPTSISSNFTRWGASRTATAGAAKRMSGKRSTPRVAAITSTGAESFCAECRWERRGRGIWG